MVPIMAHQEVRCLDIHLRGSPVDPSEGSLVVPMMSHHRMTCTGPTRGDFLSPAQRWVLMRCRIHSPAVVEAILRTRGADEKVAAGPNLSAVRRYC